MRWQAIMSSIRDNEIFSYNNSNKEINRIKENR